MESTTLGTVVRVNHDTYYYKWLIRNIYIFHHSPQSTKFTTGVGNEYTWYLDLADGSGLCITLLDCKEDIVNVTVKIYSLNRRLHISQGPLQNSYVKLKLHLRKGEGEFLYDFGEFRHAVVANDYSQLPSNGVTIICEITHLKPQRTFENHSLFHDLKLTLQSGKNSDVTILVKDKEFRVHKFMLALRSPVFSAMFRDNVNESEPKIIKLTDIDKDVMEILLEYIYTGILRNIDNVLHRLLIAADKYALEGLKRMCSKKLFEKITPKNVCSMVKLADKYRADDLKEGILDYLSSHRNEVMRIPEYESISDMRVFSLRQIVVRFRLNHF